jgi:ABC-2 type transport system ATP-binding protein
VTAAIWVDGLSKTYPVGRGRTPLTAVDRLTFQVEQGEVFGFLGPNGAGKTTTIRMLTGLSRPSGGTAAVLGHDLSREITQIKRQIGVAPESSNLYDELTARDNLIFAMELYGVPRRERAARAGALLERFRLEEKANVPFARLSKGMKRALTIAAALAHRPALVFLDEPTTGLDVMSARGLRQMIADLRGEGVTVFLTTHYLEEAERLCDRVAILVRGRLVALDRVEALKAKVQRASVVEVQLREASGEVRTVRVEAKDGVGRALQHALAQAGDRPIVAVRTVSPTFEEVFVELTGLSSEAMLAEKGGKAQNHAPG